MGIFRQHINDAKFKMTENLNVVSGNRSFLRLVNKADCNFNLGEKMYPNDAMLISTYLHSFEIANTHRYVILPIKLRGEYENCLFYVEGKENDAFSLSIRQFDYLEEVYENSLNFNLESEMGLTFLNAEYFIYDVDSKTFALKNSEVGFNSLGISTSLPEIFKNNLDIDIEKKKNKSVYDKMLFDVSNGITGGEFQFAKGNDQIKIFTKSITIDGVIKKILCIVDKDNKKLVSEESGKLDGLTLLYNKKTITEIAKNQIDVYKTPSTVFIVDIDHFKEFNDTYGHQYGDEVLLKVTKVLKDSIGSNGYVGRIGGDEFMCITDKTDEESIRNTCKNIRVGIQWSVKVDKPDMIVSCSIGAAVYPKDANTFDEVFNLADKCLYIGKNKGRNCYVFYKKEIHDKVFFQHEDEKRAKSTKVLYAEKAEKSINVLKKLYTGSYDVKKILTVVKEELNLSRVTLFNSKLEAELIIGKTKDNPRKDYIKDSGYFSHYNEKMMYISDNILDLDTIDRAKYKIYADNDIASTIEIAKVNKNGKVTGVIAYDVLKPARTFKEADLVFVIIVSKLILQNMKK